MSDFIKLISTLSLLLTFTLLAKESKQIDKICAVVGDQIITSSIVKQVQATLPARKNISPSLFSDLKMSEEKIIETLVLIKLVRIKLSELNINITDSDVESEIKSKEKALGLTRDQLTKYLQSGKLTFEEFFEVVRATIEFSTFIPRVITPLISITDQEIKNLFYKRNNTNKSLAFTYSLRAFQLPSNTKESELLSYRNSISDFIFAEKKPTLSSSIEESFLQDIKEDEITPELKNLLKATDEGALSSAIKVAGKFHYYFVKEKNLVESATFLREKDNLYGELMEKRVVEMLAFWQKQEESTQYVKYIK